MRWTHASLDFPCPLLRVSCFTLVVGVFLLVVGHAERLVAQEKRHLAAQTSADIESKLVVAAGRERQWTPPRCRRRHVVVPNVNIPEQMHALPAERKVQAPERQPFERNSLPEFRPIPRRRNDMSNLQVPVKRSVHGDHLKRFRNLRSDTTFGHCQEGSGLAAARTYDAETIRREFSVKFQYVSAYSVAAPMRVG